jgi:hypothetical protein
MTPKRQAQSTLRQFVVWGFALGLLGGLIMGLTWPGTQVGTLGDVEETGSQVGFMIGVLFAWVGNALLLVGLIGWGVKFGRDASASGGGQELAG